MSFDDVATASVALACAVAGCSSALGGCHRAAVERGDSPARLPDAGRPAESPSRAKKPTSDDTTPARPAAAAVVDAGTNPCGDVPPAMACIPAGPFIRGVDVDPHRCTQHGQPADLQSAATPAQTLWLGTYYLDLTEVTNEAYQICVSRGGCRPAGALYPGFREARQPVTGVSWHDAVQYCQQQGRRLPTEAEWEKAARGPDGAPQPWGHEPATCRRAAIRDATGRGCGARVPGVTGEVGRIAEVGSRPAGRYGLYDMVGNAEEWVADWWSESYRACGEACAGTDPRGPCAGAAPCEGHIFRVVRGGSWYWSADHATGYHRRRHVPSNEPFHHFGFRCAADPVPTDER